jgi:membrane protein DedA with SNARE-associated domain
VRRYGHWLSLSQANLGQARRSFERHGGKVVSFGALVLGVRSLIAVPARLTGMPIGRFLAYTALGSSRRNAPIVGLG